MSVRVKPGDVFHERGKPGYTVLLLRPSRQVNSSHPICMGTPGDYWECLVTFADGSVMIDPGLMITLNNRIWIHDACTRIA